MSKNLVIMAYFDISYKMAGRDILEVQVVDKSKCTIVCKGLLKEYSI